MSHHSPRWVTFSAVALLLATVPPLAIGQDRILGFETWGGSANTDDLTIRRPPLVSGSVTTTGADYDAVGSWTEHDYWNGDYTYTVSVKASGRWNASSHQARETLALTLTNYKELPKFNGTWTFKSTATCSDDPWRFPIKCTGPQVAVTPPGADDGIIAAVPYPLSAAGRLTSADLGRVSLAEIVVPRPNATVRGTAQVSVKAQIHDANISPKTGQVRIDVRPYGSADFPSQQTSASYQSKTVPAGVGMQASQWFDLSKTTGTDWQVAATFIQGTWSKRSAWVRFRTQARAAGIATLLNIEAESLAASATGGASVQQMPSAWSEHAQLFWGAKGVGDTLTLTFDVPVASAYNVELYMTRAPDFGNAEVRIGDAAFPVLQFSGFAPKVMPPGPVQMGKFELAAGANTIRFRITGKYKDSKGFRLGIDRLRLYPAPR